MIWSRIVPLNEAVKILPSSTSMSRTLQTRMIRLLAALRLSSASSASSMKLLLAEPIAPGAGHATNVTVSGCSLTRISTPPADQARVVGERRHSQHAVALHSQYPRHRYLLCEGDA